MSKVSQNTFQRYVRIVVNSATDTKIDVFHIAYLQYQDVDQLEISIDWSLENVHPLTIERGAVFRYPHKLSIDQEK
jgi:hypothetical protein